MTQQRVEELERENVRLRAALRATGPSLKGYSGIGSAAARMSALDTIKREVGDGEIGTEGDR